MDELEAILVKNGMADHEKVVDIVKEIDTNNVRPHPAHCQLASAGQPGCPGAVCVSFLCIAVELALVLMQHPLTIYVRYGSIRHFAIVPPLS